MVPNVTHGSGVRGLLLYLLVERGSGEPRPGAQVIGGTLTGVSVDRLCSEFGLVRRLRPGAKEVVVHHSLSYTKDENPTDEQIRRDATRYMEHMGLGDHPYALVVHRDKSHVHVHIPSCKIGFQGEVWNAWKDQPRSQIAAACVEREFGLPAPPRPNMQIAIERKWAKIQAARPEIQAQPANPIPALGKEGAMAEIKRRIEALPVGLTLPEFVHALELEGVRIRPTIGGTKISGWNAQLVGSDTAPEKLSKIHRPFSWNKLLDSGRVVYDEAKHFDFALKCKEVPFEQPFDLEPIPIQAGPYPRDPHTNDWDWQPAIPIPAGQEQDLVDNLVGLRPRPRTPKPSVSRIQVPAVRLKPEGPKANPPRPRVGQNRPTFPDVAARVGAALSDVQGVPGAGWPALLPGSREYVGPGQPSGGQGDRVPARPDQLAARPDPLAGVLARGTEAPRPARFSGIPGRPDGGVPFAPGRSPGGDSGSRGRSLRVDRGGLEAVDAVALTARIYSPWECAGLDLRRDPALAGSPDLRLAGVEAQRTLHLPDPPGFLWDANPKRVSATVMVALERGLALGELTPEQQEYVIAEGMTRETVWDVTSGLHLPVHVYQAVRQEIHDRPLEAFQEDYRHRLFLVGPDGRTPMRQAVDAAIEHPRTWITVPEMPAPADDDFPELDPGGDLLRRMKEGELSEDDYNPKLKPTYRAPEKPAVEAPGVPQEAPRIAPAPIPTPEPAAPTPAPTPRRKMRR